MRCTKLFLILFLICLVPIGSALQMNDTVLFAPVTNYTIFIDSIMLDQVVVTNTTITLHNVTSTGTNLTNINSTLAIVEFIGLRQNLTLRNTNTSTNLFTSNFSMEDFNLSLSPGDNVRIVGQGLPQSAAGAACSLMVAQFVSYPALIGLIGFLLLSALLIAVLIKSFLQGRFDGTSSKSTFAAMVVLISIALLLIVAIIVLGLMCVAFS